MDQKRKAKRMKVVDYLNKNESTPEGCFQIFDGKSNLLIGHLVDISATGMMIIADQPIQQELTLDLKVELPKDITNGEQLFLTATSIWWHQDDNQEQCKIGFKIEKSSIDLAYIMKQLFRDSNTLSSCQKIEVKTI